MTKGDIILIIFPFTDLSGNKLRPGVVLLASNSDITVSFITSQIDWVESSDILLTPTELNGLKKPSLIRTNKIATLDKSLAKGLLGKLSEPEVDELNVKLKSLFKLS